MFWFNGKEFDYLVESFKSQESCVQEMIDNDDIPGIVYTNVDDIFRDYNKPMTAEQETFFSYVNDFTGLVFRVIETSGSPCVATIDSCDIFGLVCSVQDIDTFYNESIEYYNKERDGI